MQRLSFNDAHTLDELMTLSRESFTPRPNTVFINHGFDWVDWLDSAPTKTDLNDLSFNCHFRIKKFGNVVLVHSKMRSCMEEYRPRPDEGQCELMPSYPSWPRPIQKRLRPCIDATYDILLKGLEAFHEFMDDSVFDQAWRDRYSVYWMDVVNQQKTLRLNTYVHAAVEFPMRIFAAPTRSAHAGKLTHV